MPEPLLNTSPRPSWDNATSSPRCAWQPSNRRQQTQDCLSEEDQHDTINDRAERARLIDHVASLVRERHFSKRILAYKIALITSLFVIAILSYFLFNLLPSNHKIQTNPTHHTTPTAASLNRTKAFRKALVISSWTEQDVSWLSDIPPDWEIHRYLADLSDPSSPNSVPRHQGREVMAYLTYIIDHYADLPDVAVFIHGHNRSWHQPEPMALKLSALNFTAVENDGFVNLRCDRNPGCSNETLISAAHVREGETRVQAKLMPGFWRTLFPEAHGYWGMGPPPGGIGVACCAQFAVSRAAMRLRTEGFWRMLRRPLTRDLEEYRGVVGEGLDGYTVGMLYEKVWHVVFGMEAVYCPDEDYCRKVQWSNAISCDRYTGDWADSFGWENITCVGNG